MAQRLMTDRMSGPQTAELMTYVGVNLLEIDVILSTVYAKLVKQGQPFTSADLALIVKVWSDANGATAAGILLDEFLDLLPADIRGVLAAWRAR